MINSVSLKNFGPLIDLKWNNLSSINLIIGENASGKTFLLKTIYSAIKTIEDYKKGDDIKSASEILADKLHWIFQADAIGDLVNKANSTNLKFSLTYNDKEFSYSFGKDTNKKISSLENHVENRKNNSVFLPAKEILSLHKVIIQNRDINKQFGFDDTYYDLAKALTIAPKQGKNYKDFSKARKLLLNLIDGKIEYDENKDQWRYKKANQKYSIGVTAEGIKKIAIIDTLLSNRYLDNKSIIFIDEPESALHPKAINDFCEIIYLLSKCGIQFFIASHSYFVLKKMYLIAMKNKFSIPALSLSVDSQYCYDLLEGMPENEIINESIKLYNEEIEEVLK